MGLVSSLKEKYEEARAERQYKKAAEKQVKTKTRAQYYQEKEIQEARFLREKAKAETDQKITAYKQKLRPSKPGTSLGQAGRMGGNFIGGTMGASSGMLNFLTGQPTPSQRQPTRTVRKKRKKQKKRTKTVRKKQRPKTYTPQQPQNPFAGFGF